MGSTIRLVVASANPKKVEEFRRLVPSWVELVERPTWIGEVAETAPTLEGNAYIKAVEIAHAVGDWAIADDTGLFVESLDGLPGVMSARFAGPQATDADNRALLLEKLDGLHNRKAYFRTVLALVHPGGEMHHLIGQCEGMIDIVERGDHGFGYDSVFIPLHADGRTFAQMTPTEKDTFSHRQRAMEQLPALLGRIFGLPTA